MQEHPNAAALRRLFDALEARDVGSVQELVAEDAGWTFPGRRGLIAGEHRGREAILRFLASVMTLTGGTFSLELHDIAGSDDHAVALFTGRGQRNGKTLENPTVLVVTMRDGRAGDFREFVWDLEHVEDFWS